MSAPHGHRGHETRDILVAPILLGGLVLFLLAVAAFVGMHYLQGAFDAHLAKQSRPASPLAATEARRLPPEPRLQSRPSQSLHELRDAERESLGSYGWVDRNAGVVRIPIDRAMDLVAERGRPGGDDAGGS